ncbi:hypothetical protein [Shimazuella alba]|uniref:Uncharacterized protein n=1 Tax=Shimazuella alba TaxID=2690964 RepID=A0A6I4VWG0_9BACL|nr:hypothetical protein [Shimazuella alba]MXQ54931.1 hypothetical protein [Shimazuella alba]
MAGRTKKELENVLNEITKKPEFKCFELIRFTATARVFLTNKHITDADRLLHVIEKTDRNVLKRTDYRKVIDMVRGSMSFPIEFFEQATPKELIELLS